VAIIYLTESAPLATWTETPKAFTNLQREKRIYFNPEGVGRKTGRYQFANSVRVPSISKSFVSHGDAPV
jgi:hypothetical protein